MREETYTTRSVYDASIFYTRKKYARYKKASSPPYRTPYPLGFHDIIRGVPPPVFTVFYSCFQGGTPCTSYASDIGEGYPLLDTPP